MLAFNFLLGVASLVARSASALRIPARAQSAASRQTFPPGQGFKFRPIANARTSSGDAGSTSHLVNQGNILYTTNVTLGGSEFTLQLDTGSTDLVLVPDQHVQTSLVILDHQLNSTYGAGSIAGPAAFAKLEFGAYIVDSQVFLNGTSVSFFDQFLFPKGIRGIMGIALDSAPSYIRDSLSDIYGAKESRTLSRSVLGNVFVQNPELDNFTTVYLGRTSDGEATGEGIFTIGEYIEGTEDDIKNASSIEVFTPTSWAVPMDVITVNGRKVPLNSSVRGAPSGKAIAILDTGTTYADVPVYVRDAMYSAFNGAYPVNGSWVLPCLNGAPNISFTFGGEDFYIHPLDLTTVNDLRPKYNFTICTPTFDVSGFLSSTGQQADLLLGDAFLRNTYTAYDYGSFGEDGDVIKSPSVKMRSLSSSVVDYSDFLAYRSKNLASLPPEATREQLERIIMQASATTSGVDNAQGDPTGESNILDTGTSVATFSSDDGTYQALVDKVDAFGSIATGLLAAIFVVLVGLLAVGVVVWVRRGRSFRVARNESPSYVPVPAHSKEPAADYIDEMPSIRYDE